MGTDSDRSLWRRVRVLCALVPLVAGCASELSRFPVDHPPLLTDPDRRPFRTPCKPDPEEPGHSVCVPETYVSPFAWDGADNLLFRHVSEFFAVDTSHEAINVNSLDEVADSSWFENRLGRTPLTPEAIVRGPCGDRVLDPSATHEEWLVDQGKMNGANPGFRVRIEGLDKFMLKADIESDNERATGAAAIAARFYWAFGFHSPCDSVVYFDPGILRLKPGLTVTDNTGATRTFDQKALDELLANAAHRGSRVRMTASRWLPGRTIGPFRYEGVRKDDPNDVVPHEHRRELRGGRLLAAWLNHFDSREQNSMNTWMAADARDPDSTPGHIQHWYIDLGDCFGSEWDLDGISRRLGHAYYLDFGYLFEDFATFGTITRPWDRARRNPDALLFGYFSQRDFAADKWRGGYGNPAFERMTERDGAWAARIIARFTPEHVAALVRSGDFTNPRHTAYLTDVLLARQDLLLRRYLARLSPLADVQVEGEQICAVDLARRSNAFRGRQFRYTARLFAGADQHERAAPALRVQADGRVCTQLASTAPASAPRGSAERYRILELHNGVATGPLRVHLYDLGPDGHQLAGLERPSG